jgi:hypothetical protein
METTAEKKREITPLDRLQHVFNDVLEDLAQTIKRTWAYMELEEREILQEALDAKIGTYRELYAVAMETAATASIKSLLQNMEAPSTAMERCDYCEGMGGTPSPFHEVGEYTIPCIACGGSGEVERLTP